MADSLLAIDYRTGELEWSTQFTYPDVFSAGQPDRARTPTSARHPTSGRRDGRDLVGAGDKGGTFHALDRETGEVVWETQLTPGSAFGGEIGSAAFVDGRLIASSNVGDPETNAPTNVTHVFGLDPATGEKRWTSEELAGKIFAPVSAVPGRRLRRHRHGQAAGPRHRHRATAVDARAPAKTACGPSIVDGRVLWGYGFILFGGPGPGGVLAFEVGIVSPHGARSRRAGRRRSCRAAARARRTTPARRSRRPIRRAARRQPPSTVAHASGPSSGCEAARRRSSRARPTSGSPRVASSGPTSSIVPDGYDGTTPLPHRVGPARAHRRLPHRAHHDRASPTWPRPTTSSASHRRAARSGRHARSGTPPLRPRTTTTLRSSSDLLDHLEATLCVDTGRVFSDRHVQRRPDVVAARLPPARPRSRPSRRSPASSSTSPATARPVPIMAFHGVEDPVVPYEGGGLNSVTIADQNLYMGDLPKG